MINQPEISIEIPEATTPMANFVSRSMFWLEMATIIDRIDSTKWCKLFEILWTKNKHFSFLFVNCNESFVIIEFTNGMPAYVIIAVIALSLMIRKEVLKETSWLVSL